MNPISNRIIVVVLVFEFLVCRTISYCQDQMVLEGLEAIQFIKSTVQSNMGTFEDIVFEYEIDRVSMPAFNPGMSSPTEYSAHIVYACKDNMYRFTGKQPCVANGEIIAGVTDPLRSSFDGERVVIEYRYDKGQPFYHVSADWRDGLICKSPFSFVCWSSFFVLDAAEIVSANVTEATVILQVKAFGNQYDYVLDGRRGYLPTNLSIRSGDDGHLVYKVSGIESNRTDYGLWYPQVATAELYNSSEEVLLIERLIVHSVSVNSGLRQEDFRQRFEPQSIIYDRDLQYRYQIEE